MTVFVKYQTCPIQNEPERGFAMDDSRHMGHSHIEQKHAPLINRFYQEHFTRISTSTGPAALRR